MKINPYADYISCPSIKAAPTGQPPKAAASGNGEFDTITVGSNASSDTGSFSDLLTARLSMEVRHTTPAHKLETLSKQVSGGTYPIDIDAMAAAIAMTNAL